MLSQQPEISEIWRRVTIAFASYEFEKLSKVSSPVKRSSMGTMKSSPVKEKVDNDSAKASEESDDEVPLNEDLKVIPMINDTLP